MAGILQYSKRNRCETVRGTLSIAVVVIIIIIKRSLRIHEPEQALVGSWEKAFINFLFLFARYSFLLWNRSADGWHSALPVVPIVGTMAWHTLVHWYIVRCCERTNILDITLPLLWWRFFLSSALVAMTAAAEISLPYFSLFFHFAVTFWLTVGVSGRRWR